MTMQPGIQAALEKLNTSVSAGLYAGCMDMLAGIPTTTETVQNATAYFASQNLLDAWRQTLLSIKQITFAMVDSSAPQGFIKYVDPRTTSASYEMARNAYASVMGDQSAQQLFDGESTDIVDIFGKAALNVALKAVKWLWIPTVIAGGLYIGLPALKAYTTKKAAKR